MQAHKNSLPPKLLRTILCGFSPPFSLSGRNEWGGKETKSSVSSCCFQSWAGKLSNRISCTAGALDSRKRGSQRTGTSEPLCIFSSSERSRNPCETHKAVARVQLTACRTCSMVCIRWPLSQHWNRSITHATTQPQTTAEKQKSRIYIPQNSAYPLFSIT